MMHGQDPFDELVGLTGNERTFREVLAAVLRTPKTGMDADDDQWMGQCIGLFAPQFPNALSPLRAMIWRPAKSDNSPKRKKYLTHGELLSRTEREKMTSRMRFQVMERDGFRCRYCGVHVEELEKGESLHVDHVVPIATGGKTVKRNLVTACNRCNAGKRVSKTKRFEDGVSEPTTETVPNP